MIELIAWQHRANYEPYFLSLLMDRNRDEIKQINLRVYEWWCQWHTLFDIEPGEFFHPVIAE